MKVSWDDFPNIWKNKKCSKPPISISHVPKAVAKKILRPRPIIDHPIHRAAEHPLLDEGKYHKYKTKLVNNR